MGIQWPKSPADPERKYFSKVISKKILDIGQLWTPPFAFFLVLENKKEHIFSHVCPFKTPNKSLLKTNYIIGILKTVLSMVVWKAESEMYI